MNSKIRLGSSEITEETLIDEVRQIIAEQTRQSLEEITDAQINEYLQLLLTEDENSSEKFCVHTLFEQQVEKTPEQLALLFQDQSLTYAELNRRANQLAHHLRQHGINTEILVGICISPSVELIVGILAVLKAGGALVLLDSNDSDLRWQTILADAQPTLLLTEEHLITHFDEYVGEIIALDRDWTHISWHESHNLTLLNSPENLAYVIYSSRRGILVDHQAVGDRLQWLQDEFNLTSSDAVLHKAPLTLDTSIWEIFWPLLYGGRLVIASVNHQGNQADLHTLIAEQRVSIVHFVPSELAAFIESHHKTLATQLNSLRYIFCSGEPLQRVLAEEFIQYFSCDLYNLYAPPEAGSEVTIHKYQPEDSGDVVPIGSPTHISVYLLDKYLQLVPPGLTGEIYLSGEKLARGYLHHPEATSQLFINNPFSQTSDAVLFKTGDQGRWLNDGTLELLGSTARHAWIKGYRVILDDVETALLAHPSVRDCVVLAREAETFGQELVAYIVTIGTFVPEQLKTLLHPVLHTAILPSAYVPVSTIPLTATGQVDEQALISLEVITTDLMQRWEKQLQSLSEIEQTAVIVQTQIESSLPLHLSQLLPNWKGNAANVVKELVIDLVNQHQEQNDSEFRALAFSDGGELIIEEEAPKTLTEAFIQTATRHKNKGITYILSNGEEVIQTYASLLEESKSILNGFYQSGIKPHDIVILQIQNLKDYFPVFWACLLGGITPITVTIPPIYAEGNNAFNKLLHTWELLQRPILLVSDHLIESLSTIKNSLQMADLNIIPIGRLRNYQPTENIYQSLPEEVAFFQLTSGSTGISKCIQETHQGIIYHIHGSKQFNTYQADDISCNWLPVDHVVPILTYHLKDVYLGCQQIQISTNDILVDPLKWLDLIEKYKVTHTWSPNFGYKLLSDYLSRNKNRTWDISSIKFFMNAGEQVTLPVVRDFLELVAPFGIPLNAMQPAFGMAEVCTCMTYQNHFDFEHGVHRFLKSSLSGSLVKADSDNVNTISFIDLGPPIPGVQIRIVDKENQLVPEGVIGRFQIRGNVVTPGYFNNPTANQEAFVGDGWFNSGDLGFILNGHLSLTSREKETIIIRGANFYCYEIEDVVNRVDGVEPTFVGVCAVNDPETGTEGLAIFCVIKGETIEEKVNVIQAIKSKVVTELGVNPTYIIPLSKENFPKTTSGKIQRAKLKKSLADDQFQEVIQEVDIRLANANTLPDWFYRQIWRPKVVTATTKFRTGQYLVFLDQLGLGTFLCTELSKLNSLWVSVEPGADFVKLSTNHYQIDPKQPDNYRQLLASLVADNISITRILHLWTYQEYVGDFSSLETLEQSQNKGIYSLIFLVQALTHNQSLEHQIQLDVISSYSQFISSTDDKIAYEKAPIVSINKTISQEFPGLSCRHIDLPVYQVNVNASYILREIQTPGPDQEVAYRKGQRLIPRLEKVFLAKEKPQPLPFKTGGVYLLTGGLGGIGIEIAKYLLQNYQVRLLLIGRTPLPEKSTWQGNVEQTQAVQQRIEAYLSLEQLGGELRYKAVDISDAEQLQQVVEQAKSHWQSELDGIIHLAGIYRESLLVEETWDTLAATLRPKVLGTWALHQLIKNQPNSIFISFSSVIGYFGGALVGAYAAANHFLDCFAYYQKYQCSLQSYCFSWSIWDEVGLSKGYQGKELTRARGYQTISLKQGLNSFLAALHHEQLHLLIGLDGSKNYIRQYLEIKSYALQKLSGYFTATELPLALEQLQTLEVHDHFRTKSKCNFIQLQEIPLLPDGTVNSTALVELEEQRNPQQRKARITPQTDVEKIIAAVWQDVLLLNTIDVRDNFFDLGGSSLLMAQVINKLQVVLNRNISVIEMFQYPTIMLMAEYLNKDSQNLVSDKENQGESRGEKRRQKIIQQRKRSK
jgi:amino acid adenylation domain-containing protein